MKTQIKDKSGMTFRPTHILTVDGREYVVMLWEDGFYTRTEWNSMVDNDYSLEGGLLCLHGQPVSGTWRRITRQPMKKMTGTRGGRNYWNEVRKVGRRWMAVIDCNGECHSVALQFNTRREALEYAGL